MDPIGILGAAAISAAGLCAATDCNEVKPPLPSVVFTQQVDAPKPPAPPESSHCSPSQTLQPQICCAPQQAVNVTPSSPPPGKRKIVVNPPPPPPKVEVHVAYLEMPTFPVEKTPAVTVSKAVTGECCEKEERRPDLTEMNTWITNLSFSIKPSVSFSLAISLSFALPLLATGLSGIGRRS